VGNPPRVKTLTCQWDGPKNRFLKNSQAYFNLHLTNNWAESDVLRGQLTEQGCIAKDGKDTNTLERAQV